MTRPRGVYLDDAPVDDGTCPHARKRIIRHTKDGHESECRDCGASLWNPEPWDQEPEDCA